MTGPATGLGASYHPGSGHSIYTIGSAGPGTGATGNAGIGTAVIPPTPSPAAVSVSLDTPVSARFGAPPKTAPAHRSTFSNGHHAYPFSAHGNAMVSPIPLFLLTFPLSFLLPSFLFYLYRLRLTNTPLTGLPHPTKIRLRLWGRRRLSPPAPRREAQGQDQGAAPVREFARAGVSSQ